MACDKNSNFTFVGLSSRSKSGCLACRKRKKKCDEVHPVCGYCQDRNKPCEWGEQSKGKPKFQFNINSIIESQRMIGKVNSLKRKSQRSKRGKKEQAKIIKELDNKEETQLIESECMQMLPKSHCTTSMDSSSHIVPSVDDLHMLLPENISGYVEDNNDNILPLVEGFMNNEPMMNSLLSNVVEHLRSPKFSPVTNFIDHNINTALAQADMLFHKNDAFLLNDFDVNPMNLEDVERFEELDEPEAPIENTNNDKESEDIGKYPPMDESQMLENTYASDNDLINILKSKKLHPYLRPTVQLLLSMKNTLKFISPSSPILRQLDTTGKLFLENYVTNLAMNMLDIGNKKFFLDYAITQATNEPVILYCLVAWGGMFLAGKSNEEAKKYVSKSYQLISLKRESFRKSEINEMVTTKSTKLDNDERIKILLVHILLFCAEISTGDVNNWYQKLLQCKELLDEYGGLKEFVKLNKHNKVAKWILSNIFYHDVLSTRTLGEGTLIPIEEYKIAFIGENFLNVKEYGLDPFYGLSQNLYLLLGEVASYRRILKNMKMPLPLNYEMMDGLLASTNERNYREIENSWFQIFDLQIQNSQPPKEMVDLLLKSDPSGKFLEHHLTWYELTQISLRIYIRISFKEIVFDDNEVQQLRERGLILFNILIGTKLQSLLGLSLLMLGITSVYDSDRSLLKTSYNRLVENYHIKNVQVCWGIVRQIWNRYDWQVNLQHPHYVDWSEFVNSMGWNCCFT